MNEVIERARDFSGRLEELFGESIDAILLYGSAARGEYRPGVSDLNVLVILERLGLPELRRAAPLMEPWLQEGNPPPLMVSRSEWLDSADVFPLEYSDIRDAHVLLAGRSPFAEVRIYREHLRLQLEHELRGKKIQLREGFLMAGADPERIGEVLVRSVPVFLTLFRGILRLERIPLPSGAGEIIREVAKLADFSPDPLLQVWQARDHAGRLQTRLEGTLAHDYLEAISRTATWLDGAMTRLEAGEIV